METMNIENFLGLKQISFEIKQFTVFIGPQASGKSVCTKLIYFFRNVAKEVLESIENSETKYDLDKNLINRFEEYFPPVSWGSNGFKIEYRNNDTFVIITKIESKQAKIRINYSDNFVKKLNKGKLYLKKIEEKVQKTNKFDEFELTYEKKEHLYKLIKSDQNSDVIFNQLFIPAGRSFFANLQTGIFTFLSSNNALDPFLRDFGSYYENIKIRFNRRLYNISKTKNISSQITKLSAQILKGTYLREKNKDYLVLDDKRKINLTSCSSGQQEVLPLTMILSTIPFSRYIGGGINIYIEEPEAHLFPVAQKEIIDLLAIVRNSSVEPVRFIITTHSPYILSSFNNLIQANNVYQTVKEDKKKELEKIIKQNQLISISDVSVYSIRDGRIKDLISKEANLIDTNSIDDVSTEINNQFNKLLDLEY